MQGIVDARGLSSAEQSLLIERAIDKAEEGEIVVLADDHNGKGDIYHAPKNHEWMLKGIEFNGGKYRITISKD